ncbi:hypothetical protein [Haloarcula marina]|uniref:hypothetical protein n=1 Tax=Haloarcula marina TaxID=2961574 RepID=UPI0020B87044|nr:hypothetical protein [Halomicroarcula marina]
MIAYAVDGKCCFQHSTIGEEPQVLQGFVNEHRAVATPEVMEVYGLQREEGEQRLQNLDGVSSIEAGGEDLWTL